MLEKTGSSAKAKLNESVKKINTEENRRRAKEVGKTLWSKFYEFAKKQDDKIFILGLCIMLGWDLLRIWVWSQDVMQINKWLNMIKLSYYVVFGGICYLNMIEDERIGKWMGFMK